MTLGLTIFSVSVGMLVALIVLFRAETNRGERIVLSGLRNFFDRIVISTGRWLSHVTTLTGAGTVRATLHYFIHKALSVVLALLSRIEARIAKLQHRNKHIAKIIRNGEDKTHLDAIATYKEEHSLSEEEKRKRRMH